MPRKRIRVYVLDVGRPHLGLRWQHPVTGLWKSRTSGVSKRRDALRIAAELEVELNAARSTGDGSIGWEQFCDRCDLDYFGSLEPSSKQKLSATLKAVTRIVRPACLADVDADAIRHFLRHIAEEPCLGIKGAKARSKNTIAGYRRELHAILAWAKEEELINELPRFPRPPVTGRDRHMKGRALSSEELETLKKAVSDVLSEDLAESWRYYLDGMWWSGLRLKESMYLHWERRDILCVDLSGKYPMLWIPAAWEKGKRDRLMPMAPEFAEFLLKTPKKDRKGFVFNPLPERSWSVKDGERLGHVRVGRIVVKFGKAAKIKTRDSDGIVKHASVHDLRRSFGFRWSSRVMPPVLMELMRHTNINTTMRYYVGRNAEATAELIWSAVNGGSAGKGGSRKQPRKGKK